MKRELSFRYVLAVIVARAWHRFCMFLKAASRLRLLNALLASMKIAASVAGRMLSIRNIIIRLFVLIGVESLGAIYITFSKETRNGSYYRPLVLLFVCYRKDTFPAYPP